MKGLSNLKPMVHGLAPGRIGALQDPDQRGNSTKRGYTYQWQQARRVFLDKHPCCAECQRQGFVEVSTVVDHIEPHRGDQKLFWDESNWQALCKPHHDEKTGRGE